MEKCRYLGKSTITAVRKALTDEDATVREYDARIISRNYGGMMVQKEDGTMTILKYRLNEPPDKDYISVIDALKKAIFLYGWESKFHGRSNSTAMRVG